MDYFSESMKQVLNPEIGAGFFGEEMADGQLLIATQAEMSKKLRNARDSGRYGWWDPKVCSIGDLYKMRERALADNDHVSVLNFTAMIAARESVQK